MGPAGECMSDTRASDGIELTVKLQNTRPVEVSDLGRSFQALGKQYADFVVTHGWRRPLFE